MLHWSIKRSLEIHRVWALKTVVARASWEAIEGTGTVLVANSETTIIIIFK